ncbi:hypothetical protein DSO57_1010164 [Entomophthora muscae]|uniref:Uncharacterized protein n=1 Tax=Entomophthora muscae TaxID=34485 RepID=A0ACC2UFH3_9FUNG|nr:hypothetical protein DSO57_1010164 [Entomophthora muscae]
MLTNEPLWRLLARVINIFNLSTMSIFVIETLVRAAIYEGGWKLHFSNNMNIMDLMLIFASGVLELIDLILRLEISEVIPLIATMRLVSSLRNISMMYWSTIDTELTKNELLEADIRELEYDLDLKDSDNVRLEKELAARRRKIKQTEGDIQNLIAKTSKAQATSWSHLVPTMMVMGIPIQRKAP